MEERSLTQEELDALIEKNGRILTNEDGTMCVDHEWVDKDGKTWRLIPVEGVYRHYLVNVTGNDGEFWEGPLESNGGTLRDVFAIVWELADELGRVVTQNKGI